MTGAQNDHMVKLGNEFFRLMSAKYAAGQKEHGGNLWDMDAAVMLNNAIDEAIDQVVYLLTLKEKGIREDTYPWA